MIAPSRSLALAGLFILPVLAPAPALRAQTSPGNPVLAERGESATEHDARMAWFRDAHFGLFVHWGLYAQAGGVWKGEIKKVNNCAEWLMHAARVPRAEYAAMAKDFNPTDFDADAWVRAAKAAGMKYIVLTAKHHEGFAMFKSEASGYNIVDATPFKRDVVKELAEACRKHGLKLGLYYSQNVDWYHPGGNDNNWDPTHKGDHDAYIDGIVIPQLREILTHYGDIAILWFDLPGGIINKARAERIRKAVLAANPNIIMNNRLGGGVHGDIETPEQHIPASGFPGKDWEACMTMNNTWGFAKDDDHWKSSRTLIENLADITSKGGNYLLNVGPDERGRIPAASLERLAAIGDWMKVNGEAIRGARTAGFDTVPEWGRVTAVTAPDEATSTLYAIVFDAPKDGRITLPGLTNAVTGIRLLGDASAAPAFREAGGTVEIALPPSVLGRKDFVVALALKGKPGISDAAQTQADGRILLTPTRAKITRGLVTETTSSAGLDRGPETHLGNWGDTAAVATWTVALKAAGDYTLAARIAAKDTSDGSVIEFVAGADTVLLAVKPTGSWHKFVDAAGCGILHLPAGESTVTVRVKTRRGEAPCNLGLVTLTPVK